MFRLIQGEIFPQNEKKELVNAKAGAFVEFEGKVRNHNDGKGVLFLEYEVFDELACLEAEKIILEAKQKFDILDVACIHRYGQLHVGDIAVWIGVSSAHRDAAFQACRYVIDELKHRLPIWKKEHYEMNDKPEWIRCHEPHSRYEATFDGNEYYARQKSVPLVGAQGQDKLLRSKVLVVGAGGLGCSALTHLATSGVGNITICDGDVIEVSNLHRQTLFRYSDLGRAKALVAMQRLLELNPSIHVETMQTYLNVELAEKIIPSYDLVLDCTDRFDAKYALHDSCYKNEIPLISASVYQMEGQLNFFHRKNNVGCMRCLWPDSAELDCMGTCSETGVLGVIPSIFGNFQALEAIQWLLTKSCESESKTILFSAQDFSVTKIERNKNPGCLFCGDNATKYSSQVGLLPYEIATEQLSDSRFDGCEWIDIRHPDERTSRDQRLKNFTLIPFENAERYKQLPQTKTYILVCQKGIRSRKLVKELREYGLDNFYSLAHGISALVGSKCSS